MNCSICLSAIEGITNCCTTPCGHHFHTTCLMTWNSTCPECRAQISERINESESEDSLDELGFEVLASASDAQPLSTTNPIRSWRELYSPYASDSSDSDNDIMRPRVDSERLARLIRERDAHRHYRRNGIEIQRELSQRNIKIDNPDIARILCINVGSMHKKIHIITSVQRYLRRHRLVQRTQGSNLTIIADNTIANVMEIQTGDGISLNQLLNKIHSHFDTLLMPQQTPT